MALRIQSLSVKNVRRLKTTKMKVDPETMFEIADDLLKAQVEMINRQNELIKRLMDRVEKLEKLTTEPTVGLKGLPL